MRGFVVFTLRFTMLGLWDWPCLPCRTCPVQSSCCSYSLLTSPPRRNGRIVCIPSGELLFYALGTGEYNELARE